MTSRRARPDTAPKLPLDGSSPTAERVVGSSVWAAYGDALGFISELTDEAGLLRRTQGVPLVEPVSWQRRIGGRQGVNVVLPAGCYSDDTQLRLSTARAIGPNGFDVEAFAKVELTVWPSYALGGGRGTKAAATSLAKDQIAWYANTFKGWTDCGGNGAAMRIQPHVWSSRGSTIRLATSATLSETRSARTVARSASSAQCCTPLRWHMPLPRERCLLRLRCSVESTRLLACPI